MTSRQVLGIDLAKASLPDAIAVMVDAWLEAQEIEQKNSERADSSEKDYKDVDSVIAQHNTIMQSRKSGLRLERRGNKLSIRGRLPSKENPCKWITQRISLQLAANLKSVDLAILKCNELVNIIQAEHPSLSYESLASFLLMDKDPTALY